MSFGSRRASTRTQSQGANSGVTSPRFKTQPVRPGLLPVDEGGGTPAKDIVAGGKDWFQEERIGSESDSPYNRLGEGEITGSSISVNEKIVGGLEERLQQLNAGIDKANAFTIPGAFTQFGTDLGGYGTQIEGFEKFKVPDSFTQLGRSLDASQGKLDLLTGGSFAGAPMPNGGQLGEALRQAGLLDEQMGGLADLVPDLGQKSGFYDQLDRRRDDLTELQTQASELTLDDFNELIRGGALGPGGLAGGLRRH